MGHDQSLAVCRRRARQHIDLHADSAVFLKRLISASPMTLRLGMDF
jgi:hypothetical protein